MKKMEDDYLWDQTGEPDPEIQELEQLLGTLRYQPRPLEIPKTLQPGQQRLSLSNFKPYLAIAAAIALIVLGAGLWLKLERRNAPELVKTATTPAKDETKAAVTVPDDVVDDEPNAERDSLEQPATVPIKRPNKPRRYRANQTFFAANANQKRALEVPTRELNANELKQAEAGKAQLMLALRVASAKLNLAIKKTQGTNNPNQIHNQHKIG